MLLKACDIKTLFSKETANRSTCTAQFQPDVSICASTANLNGRAVSSESLKLQVYQEVECYRQRIGHCEAKTAVRYRQLDLMNKDYRDESLYMRDDLLRVMLFTVHKVYYLSDISFYFGTRRKH